jgi:hypothetical protein
LDRVSVGQAFAIICCADELQSCAAATNHTRKVCPHTSQNHSHPKKLMRAITVLPPPPTHTHTPSPPPLPPPPLSSSLLLVHLCWRSNILHPRKKEGEGYDARHELLQTIDCRLHDARALRLARQAKRVEVLVRVNQHAVVRYARHPPLRLLGLRLRGSRER